MSIIAIGISTSRQLAEIDCTRVKQSNHCSSEAKEATTAKRDEQLKLQEKYEEEEGLKNGASMSEWMYVTLTLKNYLKNFKR